MAFFVSDVGDVTGFERVPVFDKGHSFREPPIATPSDDERTTDRRDVRLGSTISGGIRERRVRDKDGRVRGEWT
jgi:hypothetical protein